MRGLGASAARREGVVHTATLGTKLKQAVVGGSRRHKHGGPSDAPLQQAKDLHVGSEFLWTRTHR